MTPITDETGRRIAKALESIAESLGKLLAAPSVPPPWNPDPSFGIMPCNFCGGHHGTNMPCSRLMPTAESRA